MRSPSRLMVVVFSCMLAAIGTVAGGDLASGAPSGAQLQLTGISPTAGPLEGGNEVTIRADGAADVTSIDFGAVSGGTITHLSAHLLRVLAPAHDVGDVDVVLHSASANSPVTSAGSYRFVPTPEPLHLQVSRRLGTDQVLGNLEAIGCTAHGFCAVQVTDGSPAERSTALVTFGHGHPRRVQHLPHKTYLNYFLTACGTSKFCLAGDRNDLWVWNGHRWSAQQLGSGGDWALSCAPGTTRCVLGGRSDSFVHGRHGWRKVAFPRGFHRPTSLACATAHFCVAVRDGRTVRFDGTSWHVGTGRNVPANIGCASAHYCLAVGMRHAAEFDGSAWHAVKAPPAPADILTVSCAAAGRCVAATRRFAETFTYGSWTKSQTLVPPRTLAPAPLTVAGMACMRNGVCRATAGRGQTIELAHGRWIGVKNVTGYHSELRDISCASPTWCMAVGLSGEAFRYAHGHWSREGYVDARRPLVAISCTADKACVAVDASIGTQRSGIPSGGRAVRYSHGSWHHSAVIDTGHQLTDVSCASAGHCVAVDIDARAITYRHGAWSHPQAFKRPNKNGLPAAQSIDCPTVHYCATAGYPGSAFELVHGNWRKIDSEQPPDQDLGAPLDGAQGVDCISENYCVFSDAHGIEIRNHGVVGSGYPGCCDGGRAVSCASRTYCAAVYKDETHEDFDTRTYLLAGAAVQRDKRLSAVGSTGVPRGIACFAGPVCVGVTNAVGFVGR